MRGSAPLGILLMLAGLLSVPFFRQVISRFLFMAMLGGGPHRRVALVVGGVVLAALRGAS